MSSQFDFINDLSKEFLEYFDDGNRSLCRKCMDYEKMADSAPDDCLRLVRTLNEDIMKFLYCFLFDKEWTGKFYDLLNNNRFKDAVGNRTLINKSDSIRDTGNDQIHVDRGASIDVLQEAQDAINNLKYVIDNVHKIYEKGKPASAETSVTTRDKIKGYVDITRSKHKETGQDQLEVKFKDQNFDVYYRAGESKLEYYWTFLADDKNKEKTIGPKYTRFFMIEPNNYGRTVTVKVSHIEFSGSLDNRDHPFLIEDERTVVEEKTPNLRGTVTLYPDYSPSDGNPLLKALVSDSNAEEPFEYDWGSKNPDGTVYYFRKGKAGSKDDNVNWLNEQNRSGTSNVGKVIVCRARHEGYSPEGIVSDGYGPLNKDDFKRKIIGHLKIEKNSETNTLFATLEDTNIGYDTPKYSWSVDGGDYNDPVTSATFELKEDCYGKEIVCKSTCTPKFVDSLSESVTLSMQQVEIPLL